MGHVKVDLPDLGRDVVEADPHGRHRRHDVPVVSHPDGALRYRNF